MQEPPKKKKKSGNNFKKEREIRDRENVAKSLPKITSFWSKQSKETSIAILDVTNDDNPNKAF